MSSFLPDAQKAAKASWILPIAVVGISFALNNTGRDEEQDFQRLTAIVKAIIFLIMILSGLALAVYAMFKMRRDGSKGVLGPAITGIIFNLLLLTLFVLGIFLAIRMANRNQWAHFTDPANHYQVEILGEQTTSQASFHIESHPVKVTKVAGASALNQVLMTVEYFELPEGISPERSEDAFDVLIDESLAQYDALVTGRSTPSDGDERTIINGKTPDPLGVIILVARHRDNRIILLSYVANQRMVDRTQAARFFDSFRMMNSAADNSASIEDGLDTARD